ncbi:MAG: hypothetical protein WC389_18310 [Lutibacter sp.]|jgi:hypothetical protein
MRIIPFFFFQLIFTLVASSCLGQNQIEQIRTSEYEKLSIDFKDFKKIIESIEYYYLNTEKDSLDPYNPVKLRVELIRKDKAISLSTFSQFKEFFKNGENYDDLVVYYSWDNKTISEVRLILNDFYRKLSVSGSDEKKVEALFRDIDFELKEHEQFLSWVNFEIIIVILMFSTFIISSRYLLESIQQLKNGNIDKKTIFIFVITLILMLCGIIFFFSKTKVSDFFPGFELTPDNTNFVDKYGNFIGFALSIVAIIGLIRQFFKWGLNLPKEKKTD